MFAQRWKLDVLVAGGFFFASLALYLKTLAPSVLEGDSALFQYAPYTLAVPYPTGYPTYLLLGKLWVTLVPLGSIAYRMNLLSAFLGALDIALLYLVLGQILESRLTAGIAAALFATLPTFWSWAVVTKSYTLNILFVNILFLLLLLWRRNQREVFLSAAAFTFGLSLGNHSTMALFAPGLLLFLWFTERDFWRDTRRMIRLFLLVLLPLLLYLYVPWRGGELLARAGEMAGLSMPVAVARGLVSNYYSPSLDGLLRYFLATDFTSGMVRGWGEVLSQIDVYYRLLFNEFGTIGIILGALGAIRLLLIRPRLFIPLLIIYLLIVIFVLKYGPQGQQAAFLLPCHLIFTLWIASVVEGLGRVAGALAKRLALPWQRLWPVAVMVAFVLLPLASLQSHLAEIDHSRDYEIRDYWLSILERHLLEPGAGLLAHWADLTPLWYFQQVEGLRPDLFGLFPPFESLIVDWLKVGRPLYIAGPLLRASPGIESRYRMTPWGILVKVSPHGTDQEVQLPPLRYQTEVTFEHQVTLLGYDLEEEVSPGQNLFLYLEWRSLFEIDINYLVSLRLLDDKGHVISRKEDRLVSAWYPHDTFPKDQPVLDVFWLPVPADTVPAEYRLEVAVLYPDLKELVLEDGSRHLTLGVVTVR